jgi:uncharacterized repeat protein (TIGR03803 family)
MSKLNRWNTAYAAVLVWAATAIALPAQTLSTLYSFDGEHGSFPVAPLIQAYNGDYIGTTSQGGINCVIDGGCGTVFKITPSGTLTTIYSFCAQSGCTDGEYPFAGVVQCVDGNFYGTTDFGGANNSGVVFKVTPEGVLTNLHSFCSESGCADGSSPYAGLMQGSDGNFYGTTHNGGANGLGVVFKITSGGVFTTVHTFGSQSGDGESPGGTLIQAIDGNFYGTTEGGGAYGEGTVFKISPNGTLTTIYSFCAQSGCPDGELPSAALVQYTDGSFYGTTYLGGTNNEGTIFRITPSGSLTTLHSFDGTDGFEPLAGLVLATDGNLYATIEFGGANGNGTLFEMTPHGSLTTLYSFCAKPSCSDGDNPSAGLLQATNGNLYGTTQRGGTGVGTAFSFSVSLGPFVTAQPSYGKVGRTVRILGTNLTGATSVTFNGAPATFAVVLGSAIKATVPAGATTGEIQVVTPSGTLTSNVSFQVLP